MSVSKELGCDSVPEHDDELVVNGSIPLVSVVVGGVKQEPVLVSGTEEVHVEVPLLLPVLVVGVDPLSDVVVDVVVEHAFHSLIL